MVEPAPEGRRESGLARTGGASQATPSAGEAMTAAAPRFTVEEAAELARRWFEVDGEAKLLASERDQTFHLRAAGSDGYALKIANTAEDPEAIAFQNAALEHIAAVDPELATPRVVRARDGGDRIVHNGHIVRMLTWLPGRLMHQAPVNSALRHNLGVVHGRLGRALSGFEHPASDVDLMWDLKNTARLRPLLDEMEDPRRRSIGEAGLRRFERNVAPRMAGLRRQIVHNDLNPHNVVVADAGDAVSGVIDFGDLVRTPRICDVAIAAAYHVERGPDPLCGVNDYLRGYESVSPLDVAERSLLTDLIISRMTMTVLITTWRARLKPENAAYIQRNAPSAWTGLEALIESGALEIDV